MVKFWWKKCRNFQVMIFIPLRGILLEITSDPQRLLGTEEQWFWKKNASLYHLFKLSTKFDEGPFIVQILLLNLYNFTSFRIILECKSKSYCPEYKCPDGADCKYLICTGLKGTIKCNAGSLLSLTSVWFGRITKTICPSTTAIDNCIPDPSRLTKVLQNGKRICDKEESCTLQASYNFADSCGGHMWGDPCPGRAKYLRVSFTCTPGCK